MHYYFISGTSRGIGRAIAEELLKQKNNYVIGFGRTNYIKHNNYEFIPTDLLVPENAANFRFIDIIDAESIVLINNSGMIGNIDHVGSVDNQSIIDAMNLNFISPAILTNNFVKAYLQFECKKIIINISSGAAKYAIESWGTYCAGKSALEMYTAVAQLEQNIQKLPFPFKFFSVAPGIVDTKMQEEIRSVSPKSFGDVDKFVSYKETNKLVRPAEVAIKLIHLIDNSNSMNDSSIDLRNISI